jgi:hypothetical protein
LKHATAPIVADADQGFRQAVSRCAASTPQAARNRPLVVGDADTALGDCRMRGQHFDRTRRKPVSSSVDDVVDASSRTGTRHRRDSRRHR